MIIVQEEEYSSNKIVEDESASHKTNSIWIAQDEIELSSNPLPSTQTISGNILRQKGGPAAINNLFTPEQWFKFIMRPEICDIILRETNREGKRVCDVFNNDLLSRFPDDHHQKHFNHLLKLSCMHLLVF